MAATGLLIGFPTNINNKENHPFEFKFENI